MSLKYYRASLLAYLNSRFHLLLPYKLRLFVYRIYASQLNAHCSLELFILSTITIIIYR